MKKHKYLISCLIIATFILIFIISFGTITGRFSSDGGNVAIPIVGLEKTVRILHITDSHVSVINSEEAKYHDYGRRMDKAYDSVIHSKELKMTTPEQSFLELMTLAKAQKVDRIVLTGDIVNNPSKSSVRFISESLNNARIPSIYIAGNHDWHYEGMTGAMAVLRDTWIQESLLPLYQGSNPLYFSHIVGRINFVAIDNSTYQITNEQLEFFRDQLALDLPVVLLMHIPLYLPKNASDRHILTCGDPRWGWDTDNNYKVESRERWSKKGNLRSTIEFLEAAKHSAKLVAILAGHTHKPSVDKFSDTANQYVTGSSVHGQYRLITFEPKE